MRRGEERGGITKGGENGESSCGGCGQIASEKPAEREMVKRRKKDADRPARLRTVGERDDFRKNRREKKE